jgi:glycosyltransferase involved in cell wall biosynthesis
VNVLHLFSNAKWTGPAEPALNLCGALRALGVQADFACAPDSGESINKVVETARDRGIEPILRFHLSKHRHPIKNFTDRLALRKFLAAKAYAIVHCHLDNDHRIALGPARGLGIPLVRSSYEGAGFPGKAGHTRLLKGAAFLIEPSRMAMEHDARVHRLPPDRMRVIPGAVDTARFDPAREVPDARRWLTIPPDAFVVGIVARMQTHRHYDDFFHVIRRLGDGLGNVHAIVVGRGTRQETVTRQPVRALRLARHVHFPGYVDGENYVGMLRAFDVEVYLMPGTDGTCRAVREAMAMGKPVVAANRGMLREIVDHGKTGIVFDGTPDALFAALHRLATHRQEARTLGRAAREKALAAYSLEAQAAAVIEVYQAVQSRRPLWDTGSGLDS